MTYQIMTYIGDYPVESQKYWDVTFPHLIMAEAAARIQHSNLLQISENEHYTVVINVDTEDEDVLFIIYQDRELRDKLAEALADKLAYGEVG